MKRMIISLIITAACLFGVSTFLPEHIHIDSFVTALYASGALALVNAFIRPVVKTLTGPINFVSLGLFSLVINALMLMIVDYFVDGFEIYGQFYGLIWAIILGVAISVLTGGIEKLTGFKGSK